jgi:hypothetical protein
MRLAMVAAACVAGLLVSACDATVSGSAGPTERTPTGRATLPSNIVDGRQAVVGQCLDTARATIVDCVRPHDAEVISIGRLPENPPAPVTDEPAITAFSLPICRAALAGYLGSPDADATNVLAWALWPSEQGWAKGERWLLCTVAEVGAGDQPKMRTGSLRGALAGDGIYQFQTCSLGSPSRDSQLNKTACDNEHLGEALPGVIGVGAATDPMPAPDTINALAQRQCGERLAAYLGAPANPEVRPAWRIPNPQSWTSGYTNIVCYAEPIRPVTVRLRALGAAPLPI